MAVDLRDTLADVGAGRADPVDVLQNVEHHQIAELLDAAFSPDGIRRTRWLGRGRIRRHGDTRGVLALHPAAAKDLAERGVPYIYAVDNGDTQDFPAIRRCAGFFTPNPAPTAFAAVQAVSDDRPTLVDVNCRLERNGDGHGAAVFPGGHAVRGGEWISVSGHRGAVYPGRLPIEENEIGRLYDRIVRVARSGVDAGRFPDLLDALAHLDRCPAYAEHEDELAALARSDLVQGYERVKRAARAHAPLTVAATAHTPDSVALTRLMTGRIVGEAPFAELGDVEVGLMRDERMWSEPSDRELLQLVFLGEPVLGARRYAEVRERYLEWHTERIHRVLVAAGGRRVVARTLCMPFDKIFPADLDVAGFADRHGLPPDEVSAAVQARAGENEIYAGARGMRMFCQRTDIAELWLRAVLGAARRAYRDGAAIRLRLLLATITLPAEAGRFLRLFDRVAAEVLGSEADEVIDGISIMVETAGAYLALEDFLETRGDRGRIDGGMFGSNDFTAACLNFHREDAPRTIIPGYVDSGLLDQSPFERLDTTIVGPAIINVLKRARWKGAMSERHLWGFGGELAGDWDTVQWLVRHAQPLGLNYTTTAPHNVIPALIAAAQARLRHP